jgi:O-antigen/teichoic acid export membrane protein
VLTTAPNPQRLVLRNTLIAAAGSVIATPLSMVVTGLIGHFLGAADFGNIYLAGVIASFGFLLVEFGQPQVVIARVARDRSLAGALLGTTLAWRLGAAIVLYGVTAAACLFLYPRDFQLALALVSSQQLLLVLTAACQETIKGFERSDIGAYGQIALPFLSLFLVGPTLLLGGGLAEVLIAQVAASGVLLVLIVRLLPSVGIGRVSVHLETLKLLLREGRPFLFFSFAMMLQPNIDAVLLSQLASDEVVGWHAAARRLVGQLVQPAALLVGTLYPTLARLHVEDQEGFRNTVRGALRGTVILAIPIALCCALYRQVGIMIFGQKSFGPAEANLVVLAPFLFLMYFSMPLGCSIMAAGKQKSWAVLQFACVGISTILDPLLIPLFQRRMGNGGLGVCVASVVSEVVMVGAGLKMAAPGVFDRSVWIGLLRALLAGAAMAAVGYMLASVTPFVAAPIALTVYLVTLWAVGGLNKEQLGILREAIARKRKRA